MKRIAQVTPDGFLIEKPSGAGDRVGQGLTTFDRQIVEDVTRSATNPDLRCIVHTSRLALVDSLVWAEVIDVTSWPPVIP